MQVLRALDAAIEALRGQGLGAYDVNQLLAAAHMLRDCEGNGVTEEQLEDVFRQV
jgi:hypothetical protein